MLDRARLPVSAPVALRRGAWNLSGGLFLEVLAGSIALVGLIQGAGWWWALMSTAALLLAIPAALRSAGLPAWAASLIDLLALIALINLVYEPRASVLGVVPTPSSIAGLRELFAEAARAIQVQGIPAEPLPELTFFIVVFGGVLAVVLDLIAVTLRLPALTALALGVVMTVPAVLQPTGLSLTALGAGAAAWLVLLTADGRIRFGSRGGGPVALAVGASVTLLSLMIAATAPGFTEFGRTPTAGPVSVGNSVNPLIDLGRDLREPVPVDVLSYTNSSTTPTYLQLTTLDRFSGTVWSHSPGTVARLKGSTGVGGAPGLSPSSGISAQTVTTKIDVQNLQSEWVPTPYPATALSDAAGAAGYQTDDLTVFARGGSLSGRKYTAKSLDVEPTATQLSALGADAGEATPASLNRDLYLPANVPGIITQTARQIQAGAEGSSRLAVAVAIQDYFQSSLSGFTYSTDTPDSVDGTSLDVVAQFLRSKEGYCVHFATAMAVIARVLGIPSRIAIGYLPGTPVSQSGKSVTYEVDSSDLHAWPQLYFPGAGWLDFEPTVSRGAAPAYSLAPSDPGTLSTGTGTGASAAPAPVPSSEPTSTPLPTAQLASGPSAVAARNGVPLELGLLVMLAALASPAIARALRRRGRLTRLREDGSPPTLAWDEVRDTARDLGFAASPTETPRAFAARLSADWGADAAHQRDLDDILEQVELTAFGPPRPWERYFELADKAESVIAALRASRPWQQRLLATLLPLSLFAGLGDRGRVQERTVD